MSTLKNIVLSGIGVSLLAISFESTALDFGIDSFQPTSPSSPYSTSLADWLTVEPGDISGPFAMEWFELRTILIHVGTPIDYRETGRSYGQGAGFMYHFALWWLLGPGKLDMGGIGSGYDVYEVCNADFCYEQQYEVWHGEGWATCTISAC